MRFALLCLIAGVGCSRPLAAEEQPPAPVAATTTALPPLAGEWMQTLTDGAGKPAGILTVPLGSTEKKPLIVGVHGAESRPDWMCGAVRDGFGPDTFVVCPHPVDKLAQVTSWSSGPQLRAQVDRAVAAAFAAYGDRIDASRIVYFGHSQGAMALPGTYSATAKPARPFSGAVVFEGLAKSPPDAALTAMGVHDVLVVSGQSGWAAGHAALAKRLEAKGLHAWYVRGTFGHFFTPDALAILHRETPALLVSPEI